MNQIPPIKKQYDQVFDVEIDCWAHGLQNFPGKVRPELVHRVIKEITHVFRTAIEHNLVFDVIAVAEKFNAASQNAVAVKELVFSILAQLPAPAQLNDDGLLVLGQIIDHVEQSYSGALERLEKRWKGRSLLSPSFPTK